MLVSRGRWVALWASVSTGAAGLVAVLLPVALAGPGGSFEAALVWGCAVVTAATTGWLWAVTTVVAADALRCLVGERRGVPAGVRRALVVLGGAAVLGGLASPVVAAGQGPAGPQVLAGLRLPERIAVAATTSAARPAAPPVGPVGPVSPGTVEVAPGDSLWDIAARELGAGTSWPAVYALNRDVVGPDPGVITPGQRLVLPADPATGAR